MALSAIDKTLLERCLAREPSAWRDFVDRFMGLVVHVINHTARARSIRLSPADRDDLCAEVFLTIVKDDLTVLRRFRGQSSLATYLTVIARRVVVRKLIAEKNAAKLRQSSRDRAIEIQAAAETEPERRLNDQEQVDRLIEGLEDREAEVVRMYHLEGKSYREISRLFGLPENSIGPLLSRAREKMRQLGADPATS